VAKVRPLPFVLLIRAHASATVVHGARAEDRESAGRDSLATLTRAADPVVRVEQGEGVVFRPRAIRSAAAERAYGRARTCCGRVRGLYGPQALEALISRVTRKRRLEASSHVRYDTFLRGMADTPRAFSRLMLYELYNYLHAHMTILSSSSTGFEPGPT
jgi:hypothetical protein